MNEIRQYRLTKQSGAISLTVFALITLFAATLPIATKLVQQNQENRSRAEDVSCSSVSDRGNRYCKSRTEACSCIVYTDKTTGKVTSARFNCATCKSGQKCNSAGKCEESTDPIICTKDKWSCVGNDSKKCNSKGTGWSDKKDCGSKGCNDLKGSCNTEDPCTDYTYSDWSTVCGTNNQKIRSISGYTPKNCVGKPTKPSESLSKDCTRVCNQNKWKCVGSYEKLCNSSATGYSDSNDCKARGCDTNTGRCNLAIPTCSGVCVESSSTCKYYYLGNVDTTPNSCDSLSKVCCKNKSGANLCTDQGGQCVANNTCTGDKITATGCTSTKPVCCKPKPALSNCDSKGGYCAASCPLGEVSGSSCVSNVLQCCKKCTAADNKCTDNIETKCLSTGALETRPCPNGEKCFGTTCSKAVVTCSDGGSDFEVGTKRCIDNTIKTCLSTTKDWSPGTPCPAGQECNSAKTDCVDNSTSKESCKDKNGVCVTSQVCEPPIVGKLLLGLIVIRFVVKIN